METKKIEDVDEEVVEKPTGKKDVSILEDDEEFDDADELGEKDLDEIEDEWFH